MESPDRSFSIISKRWSGDTTIEGKIYLNYLVDLMLDETVLVVGSYLMLP